MLAIAPTPLQLGNSIRQRRRELGLTQEQLAAKAGARQRTISDIERSAAARFALRRLVVSLSGLGPDGIASEGDLLDPNHLALAEKFEPPLFL